MYLPRNLTSCSPHLAVWIGASGRAYDFFVARPESSWPDEPATYLLVRHQGADRSVLSIGEATSLHACLGMSRGNGATEWQQAMAMGMTHVHVRFESPSEVQRKSEVADLSRAIGLASQPVISPVEALAEADERPTTPLADEPFKVFVPYRGRLTPARPGDEEPLSRTPHWLDERYQPAWLVRPDPARPEFGEADDNPAAAVRASTEGVADADGEGAVGYHAPEVTGGDADRSASQWDVIPETRALPDIEGSAERPAGRAQFSGGTAATADRTDRPAWWDRLWERMRRWLSIRRAQRSPLPAADDGVTESRAPESPVETPSPSSTMALREVPHAEALTPEQPSLPILEVVVAQPSVEAASAPAAAQAAEAPRAETTRSDQSIAEEAKRDLGLNANAPVMLYAGNMSFASGVDILFDALPTVCASNPDAQFVFAGDGLLLADLQNRAERSGLSARCRFLGDVSPEAFAQVLAACDFVAIPARGPQPEALARAALAMCKPVLATQQAALSCLVHGQNGLVTYDNPGSFVWGIREMLTPLRSRLQQQLADAA